MGDWPSGDNRKHETHNPGHTVHSPRALTSSFTDTPCSSGGRSRAASRTASRDSPGSEPFLTALLTCEVRPSCWDAGVKKGVEPERGRMLLPMPDPAPTPDDSIQPSLVAVCCGGGVKAAPEPRWLKGREPPLAMPNVGRVPGEAASVPGGGGKSHTAGQCWHAAQC